MLQIGAEIWSRRYLIKAKPLFLGIRSVVCLINYPLGSLLMWEPFSLLWLIFHLHDETMFSAWLHLAFRTFPPYPIFLTAILIHCRQTSCSHHRACLDIFFWQGAWNRIFISKIKCCFPFSYFFSCFHSEKANCLGRDVNLHLDGDTSLRATLGREALIGMTLICFEAHWRSLPFSLGKPGSLIPAVFSAAWKYVT